MKVSALTREDDFVRYLLVRDVDRVAVVVIRNGREETVYVEPAVFIGEDNYVAVDPLQRFGIVIEERDGVIVVVNVIDDSPAYRAGIRRDDVLVTFGGRTYRNRNEVETAIRDLKSGEAKVQVRRGDQTRDLSVNISDRQNNRRGQQGSRDGNPNNRRDAEQNGQANRVDASAQNTEDKRSEQRDREDKAKGEAPREQGSGDQNSDNQNSDAQEKTNNETNR